MLEHRKETKLSILRIKIQHHQGFGPTVNYQASARAYVSFVAAKMCTVGNFFASNNHLPKLGFLNVQKEGCSVIAVSF